MTACLTVLYFILLPQLSDGVHIGISPQDNRQKNIQDIMHRIPSGAEATTVLVGCVDYLTKPAVAFVRLAEGKILDNLTEVPLPVRFLFLLLGPEDSGMDYHEVGRSISTLMSNQVWLLVSMEQHLLFNQIWLLVVSMATADVE